MRKDRERGAIIVEAILSLTVFLFVIFTLLSIANVCYIQAKISVALNSAAKEIATKKRPGPDGDLCRNHPPFSEGFLFLAIRRKRNEKSS